MMSRLNIFSIFFMDPNIFNPLHSIYIVSILDCIIKITHIKGEAIVDIISWV